MSQPAPPVLKPARCALFLDFDGTLIPHIAPWQRGPLVDDTLRELIAALQVECGGALAIVSGRSVEAIDALFEPLHMAAAGEHGAEWRVTRAGPPQRLPEPPALATAHAASEAWLARHPGTRFERKNLTIGLHLREQLHLRDAAGALAASLCPPGSGIEVLHGRGMVEIRPVGASKGHAVGRFMEAAPFAGRVPVFVGDDLSDEDGFRVVNALGGVSVKVGPGTSVARHRLDSHDLVRAWLAAACR